MTEEGVPGRAVRTVIPVFAGMTEEGVPAGTVRTIIPAFAGMTSQALMAVIPAKAGIHRPLSDAPNPQGRSELAEQAEVPESIRIVK